MKLNNNHILLFGFRIGLKLMRIICGLAILISNNSCISHNNFQNHNEMNTSPIFNNCSYSSIIDYLYKNFKPDTIDRYTYDIILTISEYGEVEKVDFVNIQTPTHSDSLLIQTLLNMPKFEPAKRGSKSIESNYHLRFQISPQQ